MLALYKLFGKLLPISNAKYKTDKPIEELRTKYLKFDFKQIGLLVILSFVFIYGLFVLFSGLINFKFSFFSESTIVVKPYPEMIFLVSAFSGLLLSSLVSLSTSRYLLKDDWAEYLAYNNLKYRFNYIAASKYVFKGFGLVTGLLVIMFFDWHSAFGPKEIQLNGLLSLGTKTYLYEDITELKDVEKLIAPNGDIVNDPHYLIKFKDGKKWNSRNNGFADYMADSKIMDLALSKTNLKLIEVEFDSAK